MQYASQTVQSLWHGYFESIPTVSRPLQGRGAWATAHQMKPTACLSGKK